MKKALFTGAAPAAIGPYSQAVQARNLLFISGQIPVDPLTGLVVDGGIEEQTARVLDNLEAIVIAAGLAMANVTKTTVYLKDMNDFGGMNKVYGQRFSEPFPARATVEVARLPKDVLVEIEAVAVRDSGS